MSPSNLGRRLQSLLVVGLLATPSCARADWDFRGLDWDRLFNTLLGPSKPQKRGPPARTEVSVGAAYWAAEKPTGLLTTDISLSGDVTDFLSFGVRAGVLVPTEARVGTAAITAAVFGRVGRGHLFADIVLGDTFYFGPASQLARFHAGLSAGIVIARFQFALDGGVLYPNPYFGLRFAFRIS